MKLPIALTLAAGVALLASASPKIAAAQDTQPVTPATRIDLFNGRDFSGWTFCMRSNSEPSKTWTATNGVIHCTGQPYGYARTTGNYRDYKLTVEWRFLKVAPHADNSGIFVHVQPPDMVWPKGFQCQGQNQHQGDLILMSGAAFKGYESASTNRVVPTSQPPNERPIGQWNTYEIACAGANLKVSVNGKLMNEAADCNVSSGAIGIQSEGGDLEVRNIFLEPLKSP